MLGGATGPYPSHLILKKKKPAMSDEARRVEVQYRVSVRGLKSSLFKPTAEEVHKKNRVER
jgi:hypothetical protein